jgi:DNA topoisomerase-1
VLKAVDAASSRLGNTRAVCRKYYVHPELLRAYLMGDTVPLPEVPGRRPDRRRHREAAALRRDEIVVLQFLQERIREPA